MRTATAILALMLMGCAPDRASVRPPAPNAVSRGGVPITIAPWALGYTAQIEDEVDAAAVPADWCVVVRLPVFECPFSPTGLVRGTNNKAQRRIDVGWREWPYEQGVLLPALDHEVQHINSNPD